MTRACPLFPTEVWKPVSVAGLGRPGLSGLWLMACLLMSAAGRSAGDPFEQELKRVNAVLVKGEPARALPLAQDVLRRATDPGAVANAAYLAQCALRQLERPDEIGPMYKKLLEKQPDNWGLVRQNAVWQLYGGQFGAALEGLKRGLDPSDPLASDPGTWLRPLSMCYVGLGNLEEANRCFSRARAEAGGARAQYEQDAKKVFAERLAKPSDPAVCLKFVKEVILSKHSPIEPCHAAAAKELREALKIPGLPAALELECTFQMATSLHESRQYVPAAEAFATAASLASRMPAADRGQHLGLSLFNQGYSLAKAKEWDKAIEVFNALIQSGVDDRDPGGHIMETNRNYRHRAALEISKCYEAKADYRAAYGWAVRARDQYQSVSCCGTCQENSRERLNRRLDELAARAGGILRARHAVSSGLVWRRWYVWTPAIGALAVASWLLRRRCLRARRRLTGPPQ